MTAKHLDLLRTVIASSLAEPMESSHFGRPDLMQRAFARVRSTFDTADIRVSERSITATLLHLFHKKELRTFIDVKYACFGICQQTGPQAKRLIEDRTCFNLLLNAVYLLEKEPRRFRKCYQGLLSGYFSLPLESESFSQMGRDNGQVLRSFLKSNLDFVQKCTPVASWVLTLSKHDNLLENEPCSVYGEELLNGESAAFTEVCDGLLIPSDSWLRGEAIRAQVAVACRLRDSTFKDRLEKILSTLLGRDGFACSDRIAIDGIATCLKRYAKCSFREEHAALRDAAISKIGNPWLHRPAWDARVGDDEARTMVDGWLKRTLIRDFFSLLAADGLADSRRLNYWLGFAEEIEDMWFVLGPTARRQSGHDYKVLRQRAKGRMLNLENGGNPDNNAFVMRMGSFVLVEFGASGNACYIFNAQGLPFDLSRAWLRGDTDLKSSQNVNRLLHRDSPSLGVKWEEKFDEWIVPRIGWQRRRTIPEERRTVFRHREAPTGEKVRPVPSQPPRPMERNSTSISSDFYWPTFTAFIKDNRLSIEDKRHLGGALWIPETMTSEAVIEQLRAWGFRFKQGKGWWKG